jgi:hypothetical protein
LAFKFEIIGRWTDAQEYEKPEYTKDEMPLWNAAWPIFSSCAAALNPEDLKEHLDYLSGRRNPPGGITAKRP